MIGIKRTAALVMAAFALAVGTAAISSATASAANYNGVCGSSYGVVDHTDIGGGTIWLTYSSSTGENCVVTVRDNPGAAEGMNAWVKLSSSPTWHQDPGNFTTYAGPVYVSAPHQCIDWGGGIESNSWTAFNTHCI
jgi:hypothetical protein